MLSVRMKLIVLIVFLSIYDSNAAAVKKSIESSSSQNTVSEKTKIEPKKEAPAIIAFEIVNEPEKNTTGKSNSKRTIESSLGYGYHGHSNSYATQSFQPGNKFVIYKYSQNDIPPYTTNSKKNEYSEIQKSIDYNLGTITSQAKSKPSFAEKPTTPVYVSPEPVTQYYNPGTTLYTTYDQHGLGGISNQIPYQSTQHSGMVPVIILRVYSNQLTGSQAALHTNLPQSHPYSDLNNVNLQSYLQNYVQQYLQNQQLSYQPQYQQHYQQMYVPNYQVQSNYQTNLPTNENYPSKQHTRVVFHSDNNGHIPVSMYKTPGLSTYKSISYPMYIAPQPAYSNEEEANVQYAYTTGDQNSAPQYMYVYQNQNQDYNQNNYQQYDPSEIYASTPNELSSQTMEDTANPPYNYHAHPTTQPQKDKRSKSNKVHSKPGARQA